MKRNLLLLAAFFMSVGQIWAQTNISSLQSAIQVSLSSDTYTGAAITPIITITDAANGNYVLQENTDYTVAITPTPVQDAGTYTVNITAAGSNYTGSTSTTFEIQPANISGVVVEGIPATAEYSGAAQTPQPTTVTFNGNAVDAGDYSVGHTNNTNVGTAQVVLTATPGGNFTGTKSVDFTITPKAITEADFTATAQTFTGEDITQDNATILTSSLAADTDYSITGYTNNRDAGTTATVNVHGEGNYTGNISVPFTINAADASTATVTATAATFTGTQITPEVVVELNGVTLQEGTDYTIDNLGENINAGTDAGTFDVVYTANLGSTTTNETFTINPADISEATLTIADKEFTGQAITPEAADVTGTFGDYTLQPTDIGSIANNGDNMNVADGGTVTVTGAGNFQGTTDATFNITSVDISGVTFTIPDQTFTGAAITPTDITGSFNGYTLTSSDFTAAAAGTNRNVADGGSLTLTGDGNFAGTVTETFNILPAALSDATIQNIRDQRYSGSEIKPEPTVLLGNVTLVKDTDYTLTYGDSEYTEMGEHHVTITGQDNITGSQTMNFNIVEEVASTLSYEITVPRVEGITTDPAPGKYLVNYGDFFSFHIFLDDTTAVDDSTALRAAILRADTMSTQPLVVKVNGEIANPYKVNDSHYMLTITNITDDITIEIMRNTDSGSENPPVGNMEITSGVVVYSVDGSIYIQSETPQQAAVYSITGQLQVQRTVDSSMISIPVSNGIYIVKVGKEVHKVIVK